MNDGSAEPLLLKVIIATIFSSGQMISTTF